MFDPSSAPAAGASPLSSWQHAPPPTVLRASYLADDVDPQTGEVTSLTTGIDPTDAALIAQMRIERGSGAAVLSDGTALRAIENIDTDTEAQIRFELMRILQPFIDRREIELVKLQISAGDDAPDLAGAFVEYRNLRTAEKRTIALGS